MLDVGILAQEIWFCSGLVAWLVGLHARDSWLGKRSQLRPISWFAQKTLSSQSGAPQARLLGTKMIFIKKEVAKSRLQICFGGFGPRWHWCAVGLCVAFVDYAKVAIATDGQMLLSRSLKALQQSQMRLVLGCVIKFGGPLISGLSWWFASPAK